MLHLGDLNVYYSYPSLLYKSRLLSEFKTRQMFSQELVFKYKYGTLHLAPFEQRREENVGITMKMLLNMLGTF